MGETFRSPEEMGIFKKTAETVKKTIGKVVKGAAEIPKAVFEIGTAADVESKKSAEKAKNEEREGTAWENPQYGKQFNKEEGEWEEMQNSDWGEKEQEKKKKSA